MKDGKPGSCRSYLNISGGESASILNKIKTTLSL